MATWGSSPRSSELTAQSVETIRPEVGTPCSRRAGCSGNGMFAADSHLDRDDYTTAPPMALERDQCRPVSSSDHRRGSPSTIDTGQRRCVCCILGSTSLRQSRCDRRDRQGDGRDQHDRHQDQRGRLSAITRRRRPGGWAGSGVHIVCAGRAGRLVHGMTSTCSSAEGGTTLCRRWPGNEPATGEQCAGTGSTPGSTTPVAQLAIVRTTRLRQPGSRRPTQRSDRRRGSSPGRRSRRVPAN